MSVKLQKRYRYLPTGTDENVDPQEKNMPTTSVTPLLLQSPASFPPPTHHASAVGSSSQLSVLSWNILLPNSQDGWWTYKMYSHNNNNHAPLPSSLQQVQQPHHRDEVTSWEYRKNLIRQRIRQMDADVVCLQEVSPISFDDDFAFMKDELGYDGMEMFRKGRFRPATFWKTSKCQLVTPVVHKDRTMLTAFAVEQQGVPTFLQQQQQPQQNIWHVLNCHLQAGKEGKRRLRQINEGVRAVMTLARKIKEVKPEEHVRLIVCGDFNGGAECAAVRYVEDGSVNDSFLEDGESVTSRPVLMPLTKPLKDVAASIGHRDPPPTLVVPELISLMVKTTSSGLNADGTTNAYENPQLSGDVVKRLRRIYQRYATDPSSGQMNVSDVERWLVDINGQVGRGSEFREAAKQMGWKDPIADTTTEDADNGVVSAEEMKSRIQLPCDGLLSVDGFIHVYEQELRGGKFWGIAHDLEVLGEPLPDAGVFCARFDRMYCSQAVQVTAVIDTISSVPCPNAMEPSDHLPVAASFM